jgi:2-haloacid dehalogenase
MTLNRRDFLTQTTGAIAAGALGISAIGQASIASENRVVAFDAFAIFDPHPIGALAESLFPGKGAELMTTWRTRQFEYTWLRSLSVQYVDFWKTTHDSLIYAAKAHNLDLKPDRGDQLMKEFVELKAYPDVSAGLKTLKNQGIRLAIVSNFTTAMLQANVKNSQLDDVFDQLLTTDLVKVFKPAPAAYQMAMDAFKVARDDVAFVPFASWDAAGAKWFGYKTFWLNRGDMPEEQLDVTPDAIGKSMPELVKFIGV